MAAAQQKVVLPPEVGFPGKTISLRSLQTVVHARAEEILETVRKRIAAMGILHRIGAGVVLAGGSAHLRGIAELTERVFRLPCSIGRPRNVSGLAAATERPEYATCCGLVQYGYKTQPGQQGLVSQVGSWLGGLFGR
jgi:cell division protein FtsA